MPLTTAEEARNWARREHKAILNVRRLRAERGDSRVLVQMEEEARRKRGHALVRLRLALADRSVPELGTDDEIGAYLGIPAPAQGVANV